MTMAKYVALNRLKQLDYNTRELQKVDLKSRFVSDNNDGVIQFMRFWSPHDFTNNAVFTKINTIFTKMRKKVTEYKLMKKKHPIIDFLYTKQI